jgi:hypothetical protein
MRVEGITQRQRPSADEGKYGVKVIEKFRIVWSKLDHYDKYQ